MTAKEKVLSVYPDAHIEKWGRNMMIYTSNPRIELANKYDGTALEAWQNAYNNIKNQIKEKKQLNTH